MVSGVSTANCSGSTAGYLSLVLHAHLPFVRHPEHPRFLEESWLFEAVAETYLPLLQLLEGWARDDVPARLTLTLSPTLCAMLRDPLLQDRCERHLNGLVELAEKELERTQWDRAFQGLAAMYHERFRRARDTYYTHQRDLVRAFHQWQERGHLEIITTAATHGLLPLLASHPPSLRAHILTARDEYHDCFGATPRGIWLPECAYCEAVENALVESGVRWFITETHGVLHAEPRPRHGVFAPIFTPRGLAVFGRDLESSRQVWSQQEGYPGDPRYRDFYRDIGYDLEFDYVKPYLPSPEQRGFTGLKYYRITGPTNDKLLYDRAAALRAVEGHARHFLEARLDRLRQLSGTLPHPPILVAPYDAELFGHWWYEGPEFLDALVRQAPLMADGSLKFITPTDYLRQHPTHQVATPAASSWGEHGYWRVWLNDRNEWIYPHLQVAQERMTELARRFPQPDPLKARALQQAARELLLAQASDWPFIIRAGTSPEYASRRVKEHLQHFLALYEQLRIGNVNPAYLAELEARDNLFPNVKPEYWS